MNGAGRLHRQAQAPLITTERRARFVYGNRRRIKTSPEACHRLASKLKPDQTRLGLGSGRHDTESMVIATDKQESLAGSTHRTAPVNKQGPDSNYPDWVFVLKTI